jgi:hypothetical protein
MITGSRSDALVLFGVTGDLALQDELPGTLYAGKTRCAEGSGHRRRVPEVEYCAGARPSAGQHHALRRDRRPTRLRRHLAFRQDDGERRGHSLKAFRVPFAAGGGCIMSLIEEFVADKSAAERN